MNRYEVHWSVSGKEYIRAKSEQDLREKFNKMIQDGSIEVRPQISYYLDVTPTRETLLCSIDTYLTFMKKVLEKHGKERKRLEMMWKTIQESDIPMELLDRAHDVIAEIFVSKRLFGGGSTKEDLDEVIRVIEPLYQISEVLLKTEK